MRKSQTAISNSVASLEVDIGFDLLIREGHKARPTEEAKRLIPYMENLLGYQRILSSVADNIYAQQAELHVYIDRRVSCHFLALFRRLLQENDDKTIHFHRGLEPERIEDKVNRGDTSVVISLDDGLIFPLLEKKTLGRREDVIVISSTNQALASAEQVTFSDILNQSQIHVTDSTLGITSNPLSSRLCCVESYDDAIQLIKSDCGWGILPYYAIQDELDRGDLVRIHDTEKHETQLYHNVYCYFSPILRRSSGFKLFLEQCSSLISQSGN